MPADPIVLNPTVRHLRTVEEDDTEVEAFYRSGKLHREDGPAVQQRRPDGSTRQQYWRQGKLHREDGPAWIDRNADGSTYDAFYNDGQLHRDDGPAIRARKADGSVQEMYYRAGAQVSAPVEPEALGQATVSMH
jgi:hypothetical protein